MKNIFILYAENSLWLSAVILAALLFFHAVRGRFSAKLPCIVWLIIALKLIIPWNIPLPQAPHSIEVPVSGHIYIPSVTQMPVAGTNQSHTPYGESAQGRSVSVEDAAACIWLAGVIVFLAAAVYRNSKLKRELNIYSKPAAGRLVSLLDEIAGDMGMKAPRLNICDKTVSPMAAGLVSPEIYLPREDYGSEIEMILRHELTHIKRGDLYCKLLYTTAEILNWFNPLVYIMASRASGDLEISCDADVVKQKDIDYRKQYSLLILEQTGDFKNSPCITTCFACGKKALKARFSEILTTGSKRKGKLIIFLALVLSLACGVFISCKTAESSPDYEQMAETWAQALENRNGEPRYNMMSQKLKQEFEQEQGLAEDGKLIYSIGWSSPWVIGYSVNIDGDSANIHYTMVTSVPETYYMDETIYFGEENGEAVVIDYVINELQSEPTAEREQLDEISLSYSNYGSSDEVLLNYILNYVQNTAYYVYTDRFYINSLELNFTSLDVSEQAASAEFILTLDCRYYTSGKDNGNAAQTDENFTVSANLKFTCDMPYRTETFMLVNNDGGLKDRPFILPESLNSDGQITLFGTIKLDGNSLTIHRMQFNSENDGLTPNGFYLTDWGLEQVCTLTESTTVTNLSEEMRPQNAAVADLKEDSRYYWVTVNAQGDIVNISEQYIP